MNLCLSRVRRLVVSATFSLAGLIGFSATAAIQSGTHSFVSPSPHTQSFLSLPPFLEQETGKPSVIVSLDVSDSMLVPAYSESGSDWNNDVMDNFSPDANYAGYFDAAMQYRYDSTNGVFVADASLTRGGAGAWDGKFLNWLTMRRIDLARQVLVGGKVRNRAGETLNGASVYVLEGENELGSGYIYRKSFAGSSAFSPMPDGAVVSVGNGTFWPSSIESEFSSDPGHPVFNIALTETTEPLGLIQEGKHDIRFGLSVYNFDHKVSTLDTLAENNQVDGQTMNPCYYILDSVRLARREAESVLNNSGTSVQTVTLYDGSERNYLCVPTGVLASNDRIVQVIEEHPMLGANAPLAEAMVDLGRYLGQTTSQYPNVISSNIAQEHSVANSPSAFDVFGTGMMWDPLFEKARDQIVECKRVFMLHVGAGELSGNFQSGGNHPSLGAGIDDISGESSTYDEALDNVALSLRQNDCRTGLPSHQELISYFVYLGEDGNSVAARRLREAAARGGFIDLDDDHAPDPLTPAAADFNAYAARNPTGQVNTTLCPINEWDRNSDCEPDAFLRLNNVSDLYATLQGALSDIMARAASGGGASVVANTVSGEGVMYQAAFYPTRSQNGETVKWTGDVSALLIDADGYLRSDGDGDRTLDDFSADPIVDTCFDAGMHTVRVALSTDPDSRPTPGEASACSPVGPYSSSLSDIGYVWSAADELADLVNVGQRNYTANSGRYILTDVDGNGSTESFVANSFTGRHGVLNAADQDMAEDIIDFVRGQDIPGMRSRQLGGRTLRLGDIVHSSPTVVGKPSENLHLLYDDASYLDFYRQYRDRRTMVYVGANDGMLHAFNAGSYDRDTRTFETDTWALGQEVWAYVPYNLLPHLHILADNKYGQNDGAHMFFVDQSPYVFDARIFGSDGVTGQPNGTNEDGDPVTTHPNGWGTVLVVGFRTGGGAVKVYPDPADQTVEATMRPAYLIFDITDPEQPPVLLAEFSHDRLGMSFSEPTALTVRNSAGGLDWFLAFGSGPSSTPAGLRNVVSEQDAHLFMLNLKTMALETGFGTQGVMDLDEDTSFVGGLTAADFDLDASTDALYFGTTQGVDSGSDGTIDAWNGKLMRTRILQGNDASTHSWKSEVMFDARRPVLSRPAISFDRNLNRWVHFGTGRLLTVADTVPRTPPVEQFLFGLKEPRATDGSFLMDTYAQNVPIFTRSNLVNVSSAEVEEGTGALSSIGNLSPGLASNTVAALEQRMMQYSADYVPGWYKELRPNERAMGAPLILGGILSQSTYLPELVPCSFLGDSYLYALRYTTGTAGAKHVFNDPSIVVSNDTVVESVQLGTSPTMTPVIHLGERRKEGEATLINVNADLTITTTTEHNLEGLDSRETSWRGL